MKSVIVFIICLCIIILMQLAVRGQSGCGYEPIKPVPPPECRDLKAICVCVDDAQGNTNCHWEFQCIPR